MANVTRAVDPELERLVTVGVEVLVAAGAGFVAMLLPVALDPAAPWYDAGFLPIVRTAVEGMRPLSVALLFGVGAALGWFGTGPVVLTGPATMAAFPVWSALDMLLFGDHNLFPIEWFVYGVLSMFGLAGAASARLPKNKVRRKERG